MKRLIDFAFSASIVMGVIFLVGAILGNQWLMLAAAPAAIALVSLKRAIWPQR